MGEGVWSSILIVNSLCYCLFVYMLAPCGDIFWVLMGPNSNKFTKCSSQALKAYNILALWSMEIIDRNSLK